MRRGKISIKKFYKYKIKVIFHYKFTYYCCRINDIQYYAVYLFIDEELF